MHRFGKNAKGFLRAALFTALFLLLFSFLSDVFTPSEGPSEDGMISHISKAYRGEDPDSLDVVFIGNSDIYRAVSPVDLYRDTRITSAVAGQPNRQFSSVLETLHDVLKHQHPKVLFLETDCMFSGTNPHYHKSRSQSRPAPAKRSLGDKSLTFLQKIQEAVKNGDSAIISAINFKFPLIKYHDNWKKLQSSSFLDLRRKYEFSNKGMAYSDHVLPYERGLDYMADTGEPAASIGRKTREQFQAVRELCRQQDIRLVLLTVPSANTWNYSKHLAIARLADQNDLTYYDYNLQPPADFDWKTDSKDGGNHLNYRGASVITQDLGKKLQDDLRLDATQLKKRQRIDWEEDYRRFHDKIAK